MFGALLKSHVQPFFPYPSQHVGILCKVPKGLLSSSLRFLIEL